MGEPEYISDKKTLNQRRIYGEDPDLLIRAPIAGDIHSLSDMEQGPSGNRYQASVFIRQMMVLFPESFRVAEFDHTIAGYCIGVPSGERSSGWVVRVRVREDLRRKGVGTALIRSVLKQLLSGGTEEVWLSVSPKNSTAINLYQNECFIVGSYEKDYFGPGEDRILMVFRKNRNGYDGTVMV